MLIGIDASRAFAENRTGIEEYSYQVIKNLKDKLNSHQVVLYVRPGQQSLAASHWLPKNWRVKVIKWPYLWTQIGLSLELLFNPVEVLFVPAHTVPLVHPARNATRYVSLIILWLKKLFWKDYNKNEWHSVAGGPENTIVTIHGLEYEFCPKAYSFWERSYMRWSIKNSCKWARKIIAVSENTKKDLIDLYKVPETKIAVIYEGVSNSQLVISNLENKNPSYKLQITNYIPYLLFIGRLEERKNILGIIKAFEILKEKYKIPHKLILAGNKGYRYESIKYQVASIKYKNEIIFKGFVSDDEKQELLKNAEVFLFPSFYEGFGLPILEAQSVGTPVVTSNISSMPEVAAYCHSGLDPESLENKNEILKQVQDDRYSAVLVDPNSPEEIAEKTYQLISDENLKNDIINRGFENVKRFSWKKCAGEIATLLKDRV